jgi:hypothetical protein
MYVFFILLFITLNPTLLFGGQFNDMPGYKNKNNTHHITKPILKQHITTTCNIFTIQTITCDFRLPSLGS